MQVKDNDTNEILYTGTAETKEELLEHYQKLKTEEPEKFKNCTPVIGELPIVGHFYEISGLRFRCSNVSTKKGYVGFHLL